MHEILFRGKRIDNCKWIYGSLFMHDGVGVCIHSPDMFCETRTFLKGELLSAQTELVRIIPETVGQFTGLTDKDGKKIFEGDILSRPSYWGIRIDYENGCFMVRNSNSVQYINLITNCPLYNFSTIANYEVIGNIHDNPELLEAGGVQ